jgi:hypothetical protein
LLVYPVYFSLPLLGYSNIVPLLEYSNIVPLLGYSNIVPLLGYSNIVPLLGYSYFVQLLPSEKQQLFVAYFFKCKLQAKYFK